MQHIVVNHLLDPALARAAVRVSSEKKEKNVCISVYMSISALWVGPHPRGFFVGQKQQEPGRGLTSFWRSSMTGWEQVSWMPCSSSLRVPSRACARSGKTARASLRKNDAGDED